MLKNLFAKLYKTFWFGVLFFMFFSTKISTFYNVNSDKALTIFECFFYLRKTLFDDKFAIFFVDN